MGHSTFERGIHPSYYKELTSSRAVEPMALPKSVVIPLHQHAGAPCQALVKKGEAVTEGQKIGDVQAFVSAPVHASISGKVKEVEIYQTPSGVRSLCVVIEGDGTAREWDTARTVSLEALSVDEIKAGIRDAGIVGMGGAAFPTSVKLNPPKDKAIEAVLLNGCECEPYLTADHRIMLEEPAKVVWGLKALMKAVGARQGIIGIEENKPDAIEAIRKAAGSSSDIKISILEAKYPQGAEKMLIKAALGKKVPPGKLPLDVGVVVNNVGTAVAVYEALNWGKPLIERVVTVSGNGIAAPQNLKVRIGTSFEEVVSKCGGLTGEGEKEVLNGGPMMGIAQTTLAVPVVKGTSGITVIAAGKVKPDSYDPCIKCGSCVSACPMALMPYRLAEYGKGFRFDEFKGWGALSCIECGSCAYACPAKRPLLQWIRMGKFKMRVEAARAANK